MLCTHVAVLRFTLKHTLKLHTVEVPFQSIQKDKIYRPVKELDMSSVKSQEKKIDNAIATANLFCVSVIASLLILHWYTNIFNSLDQFIKQISWSARTKGPTKIRSFTSLVSFRSSRKTAAIWPSLLALLNCNCRS